MQIDPLIRKLEEFVSLSDEEKRRLGESVEKVVDYDAGDDIIAQGEKPKDIHLLLDGWAGRYKDLVGGERQIMAFLIPGDICDLHVALLKQMDHSIGALSTCRVAFIPDVRLSALIDEHKNLAKGFWLTSLVDEAISREWLVSMGRRSAGGRVAHLLCEMLIRLKAVGLARDDTIDLPLNQAQMADTMGMSIVHMNRSLQKLRTEGLIEYGGRRVAIKRLSALMEFAEFDPLYLHRQNVPA